MPPAVRRRRRDAEGGRGRLQRKTILDRVHQSSATGQSELGVSVQIHQALLWAQVLADPHTLKGGPDEPSAVHNLYGRLT
jgi:hypothetical protein